MADAIPHTTPVEAEFVPTWKVLDATQIIVKPLITEKSNKYAATRNTYAFEVHDWATKPDIRAAIEKLYNVKVIEVRTIVRKGKPRRTKIGWAQKPDIKRALVQLHPDSKIELF